MRALFLEYENELLNGKYIFVIKDKISDKNFSQLKWDFSFAMKKLKVLKNS